MTVALRISKGGDSAGHPTGEALAAAGVQAMGVYSNGSFAVSRSILQDYAVHNIWTYWLHEVDANASAGGAARGLQDMASAIAAAKALTLPQGIVGILCDDNSSVPEATVLAYWSGGLMTAHTSGYRCGGYGPHAICTAGLAHKAIDAAMVAGGWEDGQPQTGIAIKQLVAQQTVGGVTCDVDEILLPETPGLLWNLHGLYVPPSTPPTPEGDPDVNLRDVTITANASGEETVIEPIAFEKVVTWSVVGGVGPHSILARCQEAPSGQTAVSIQGAAPSQQVTVRLGVTS